MKNIYVCSACDANIECDSSFPLEHGEPHINCPGNGRWIKVALSEFDSLKVGNLFRYACKIMVDDLCAEQALKAEKELENLLDNFIKKIEKEG